MRDGGWLVAVHSQNVIHLRIMSFGHYRMTGWVLQRLSAVRMRLRQRRDLLLEFIVLRHQLAVLQRTGTWRPCFRLSASPRCGVASASLSSHHRLCGRCGRIDLRIVLIGETRPPLWGTTIGPWPVDDFQRIARGRHRDGSCQHSRISHDHHYGAHAPSAPQFLQSDLYCTSATNNSLNN
jgi:hypothetical protein